MLERISRARQGPVVLDTQPLWAPHFHDESETPTHQNAEKGQRLHFRGYGPEYAVG